MHVHRGIQRRAAGPVRRVHIRALLDQQFGDVEVAVADRQHHRADAVGIAEVRIGAVGQQHARRFERPSPGEQQRRQAAAWERGEQGLQRLTVLVGPEVGEIAAGGSSTRARRFTSAPCSIRVRTTAG